MIFTILNVSQEFTRNGDEYLKVTGITEKGQESTKSIFNNIKEKWGLLKEKETLEFKMEKKGQFWNVVDILPIKEQVEKLPPGRADMSAMEKSAKEGKQEEDVGQKVQREIFRKASQDQHIKNKAVALSYVKDGAVARIRAGTLQKLDEAEWQQMMARADQIVEWLEK